MDKQTEINSLHEYLDLIEKIEIRSICKSLGDHLMFRGTSNFNWRLIPSYERIKDKFLSSGTGEYERGTDFYYSHLNGSRDELNILEEFQRTAIGYLPNDVSNNWLLLLQYAQHFGVPTRLLDFTTNPLVALYFACKENSDDCAKITIIHNRLYEDWLAKPKYFNPTIKTASKYFDDAHCYCQKSSEDNIISIIKDIKNCNSSTDKILLPEIYRPHLLDQRMIAQNSIFLIWGSLNYSFDYITQNASDSKSVIMGNFELGKDENYDSTEKGFLIEFFINSDRKSILLKELDVCGINEKSIFPGLDGIGKYIQTKYINHSEDS